MTNAQLCRRIIHLIHAPIHVYNANGDCCNIYVDNGEQQDLLSCDPDFVQELLEKKSRNIRFSTWKPEKSFTVSSVITKKPIFLAPVHWKRTHWPWKNI